MTIYNSKDQLQAVPQPSISVDEIPTLSVIYQQDFAPVYFDFEDETPYHGRESLNKRIRIWKSGDITNLRVEAVINPVQSDLSKPAVGLCDQMFKKGGPMLQQACLEHGFCPVGQAFVTEGFELPAQYVIHTAGPDPKHHLQHQERLDYLQQSYLSCFYIAKEQHLASLAIPCLGTGKGGVNLQDGIKTAVTTIREWLETAEHKLNHIVFCLVDTSQYEAVMKEMVQCFPRGTDAAGINLEKLDPVPDTTLNPPAWIHRTHIFCLKYDAKACNKISHHFHSLVNHCHTELCRMDSGIERYCNCAVLSLTTDKVYRCIILHNKQMNLIEVQVLKFSHENNEISDDIKIRLSSTIMDYLDTYFENVTSFQKYLRCEKSAWQDQHGLWPCKQLQLTVAMEIPCDHDNNLADTHMIKPKELLNRWPVFHSEKDSTGHLLGAVGYNPNPRFHKQPTEHSDFHSVENSYHFSTLNALSMSTPENTTIKTETRSENNSFKIDFKAKQTGTTGRGHIYTRTDAKRPETDVQEIVVWDDTSDSPNSFVSFTKSIDFSTIETDTVRPKEYNSPRQQSTGDALETTNLTTDRHRNPATRNILKFSKTAKESTESSLDSEEIPRVGQEKALGNDISELANSFVTFTNSTGTNIVRPKEYNIPSQQSSDK